MDLTDLDRFGAARLPGLMSAAQCAELIGLWDRGEGLGPVVPQSRETWGGGSYAMFQRPLPSSIATLHEQLYPAIAGTLNGWADRTGAGPRFPVSYAELLDSRPPERRAGLAPVMTIREAGDWNIMHRDPATAFPLQVAVLLSEPDRDFTGGAFLVEEQWPHMGEMESRPEVVALGQGDAVLFPVHDRVADGPHGPVRVGMYHGMSRLLSGTRYMLGLIF